LEAGLGPSVGPPASVLAFSWLDGTSPISVELEAVEEDVDVDVVIVRKETRQI